ncbi:unnamed protein product [Closterium sp. NIES-53]
MTEEKLAGTPTLVQQDVEGREAGDDGGEQPGAEQSTDCDVGEAKVKEPGPQLSGQIRRPPNFLSYHACLPPAAYTTVYDEADDDLLYDDAEEDAYLPELDPDMHADLEHCWDIATMTVKEALVGADKVACWVLVYVHDLLVASSSFAMLMELKELLEAAFELREISPVERYLGLEIVRDRPAMKLWLHPQGYTDKLLRRFIDEEQTRRTPKTPVMVDAYAELTFDDEEALERQDEEYQQKVGSLHFAAMTSRPNIAFACNKLGSGLIVRSDQQWCKVDCCLAYLANTCDTTLEFGSGPESLKLVNYVDADDAGNKQNRTSMGVYVFVFGRAASSWSSQRIK